jgi:hypothetical protein
MPVRKKAATKSIAMLGRKKTSRKSVDTVEDVKRRKIPKPEDPQDELVMIEFKFASCETHCISENELTGVLHVPMLQNPITGRCRIPPGKTSVQGIVQHMIFEDTTIEDTLQPSLNAMLMMMRLKISSLATI